MGWIQKLKNGLKTRKVKVFLIFLLCSFLAWFINNLSESYTSSAVFDLTFVNVPENRKLIKASKEKVDVKIQAIGFQFLGFNFKNKNVAIDVSTVEKNNGFYFITRLSYQDQIEKQLPSSMRLLQMDGDTIFFDFKELISKEVPVEPRIKMKFSQNYLLDGQVEIQPNTITVKGPMEEVDTITSMRTPEVVLADLSSDFSRTVPISKSEEFINSSFSAVSVTIKGKVVKFSEKIIAVPVQVRNLPTNMTVRTFPEKVQVLCKAKISALKSLNSTDFTVIADYSEIVKNRGSKRISVQLKEIPKNVYGASIIDKNVEYILKSK